MKIILLDSEQIRDIFRQSMVVFGRPLLISLIAIIFPWYFGVKYGLAENYSQGLWVWTIVVVIYFFRQVLVWRLNEYIVTNKRLFKIAHEGLFKRTVIETPLERILNVSYKTTGLLSVIFGFGDVEVQVVGLVEPIILRHISRPAKIKDYLWQLHGRVATNQGKFEASDISHAQERMGYTKPGQKIL